MAFIYSAISSFLLCRNGRLKKADMVEIQQLDTFYQDWLEILKEILRFETVAIFPKTGMYGYRFSNGSWDGVMGDLTSKRVDFSNLPLTHLPSRYEVTYTQELKSEPSSCHCMAG